VRVNVALLGNMLTECSIWQCRVREDDAALDPYLSWEVTFGRIAHPDEVARVAVFPVPRASSVMIGTTAVVDVGHVRQW
jgi:NAD(P)-dependent dehydrogenase (short-subunit alcohol dehydrogenase family)